MPPVRSPPSRHGLARVLSKRGLCSRSEAARWVAAGRVRVNGQVVHDPEFPVRVDRDRVEIADGEGDALPTPRYLMLHKPRGLVTTTRDERGRATVYACLANADLPWLAPVGRLDRASEGLLLFSNDPAWAAAITDPERGPDKTYHVQIDRLADVALGAAIERGASCDGEHLSARSVRVLRHGTRNSWLEIVLDRGRNRHIRRLLTAFDCNVLRLLRVAIGPLALGTLGKGQWRDLTPSEVAALASGRHYGQNVPPAVAQPRSPIGGRPCRGHRCTKIPQ